jgi:hypothetical protein
LVCPRNEYLPYAAAALSGLVVCLAITIAMAILSVPQLVTGLVASKLATRNTKVNSAGHP